MTGFVSFVHCEPDPENPAWSVWRVGNDADYNQAVLGKQLVRKQDDGRCRHRLFPERHLQNVNGAIHGGTILGLADVSMFSALYLLSDVDAGYAVTLDLQAQFIAPGDASQPLDALVELLKETRRIAFMRGTLLQGDTIVAAYTGTIRKPTSPV